MLREVHRHFIPNKVLILADGGAGQKFFAERVETMAAVKPRDNRATAYICENFVCQAPTNDLDTMTQQLAPRR